MQVNTNYNEIVLALDHIDEAGNKASSSKKHEESKLTYMYPDTLKLSSTKAQTKTPEEDKIYDAGQAREDLRALNEVKEEDAKREQLTAKVLAQANASSEKYLQLLMKNFSG